MTAVQTGRRFSVATSLGDDKLLLDSLSGSEALSQLFQFDVNLLSEDSAIDFDAVVGKPLAITGLLSDGSARYWHGIVSHFSQGQRDGLMTRYRANVVPWLWLLTRTADCRIFQKKKAPDIIVQIFKDLGLADYELRLYGSFNEREYCVQYRETDFNFVSRLMEEEGIYYYFRHEKSKHMLVLTNDPSGHDPCPSPQSQGTAKFRFIPNRGQRREEDSIHEWTKVQELRPESYSLTDYNFETPSTSLLVSMPGRKPFDVYDFPGEYRKRAEGDALAKVRMEEQKARGVVVQGLGDCRAFTTGFTFELTDHYRPEFNKKYLITAVRHVATQGGYASSSAGGDSEATYRNSFECTPFSIPFRPARVTPQPFVQGCQTAVVVGPAGEEIYTDKYGRVKVQFHWDREGKNNENSSCWIRVSHPWAGKGWGSVSIPRIGQEVIVDFLEGDADQPVIVGRVYNAESMPPFGMPAGAVISGLKSNSTKGGGGYNEMSMNDTKGKEMINIHAQYDMSTTVEHDDTQTIVSGNRTITVKAGKHTETIKGDTAITIETGNHSLTVQTGTHTETIKGNTSVIVQSGAYSLDVMANTHTHHVSGKVTENFDATQDTTVNGDVTIKSKTAKITVDASTDIMLLCGASTLTMKSDGTIKLSGANIEISGTDTTKIGVGNQNMACDKGKVATSGAAINSSAVGTHEITGAMVKIN